MRRLSFSVFLSLLLAFPAQAGWRPLYPIFGGSVPLIRVDAGGTLYAAASGGLFKSADQGETWSMALGDLPTSSVKVLAPDPVQVGTLYAGTDMGLFRTTDGGASWTRLPLNLPGGMSIMEVAIAPADTNRIFVATWGSYIWRSLDRGATWAQSSSGLSGGWSGPAFTTSMAVDPTNANRVYTSTWRGRLFRSDNAAATWTAIADGGTWANRQIFIARSNPAVLYMLHDEYWFGRGTVLRSADYGNTWTSTARPAPGATDAAQIDIDPTNENIVYVTTSRGVHRSTNGGGSWTLVFSPPGPTPMNALAIEPGTPSHVYGGSEYSGFYRSLDSGASWEQKNTGFAAASIIGLGLCRSTPGTIYAGAQSIGYIRSIDAGLSWSPIGTAQGIQNHSLASLAVHPQDPNTLLVTTWDGSASHTWRTSNGGASFTQTSTGYGPASMAFSPLAPSYVHASVSDWQGGFIRSSDGGASWSVPYWWYIYPTTYTFHPTLSNILLTAAFQYTGAALNTLHVAWSNNNGSSWASLAGFGAGEVFDVALDANNPTVLYLAGTVPSEGTRGVYKFNVSYSGGSVASISRVAGTFNSGLTNPGVRRLVYDSANGLLYASTPNGVFRSADQALTWTSVNDGLPYPSTSMMTITPDGRSVYVATSGGIWEYSDSLPVPVATPVLTTAPPTLLQEAVSGTTTTIGLSATSATAADTLTLSASSAPALTLTSTSGNPATGTLSFAPGANLRGQTFTITLAAQSTLDPLKSTTITRYLSVVGDPSTDASALISNSSGGTISTPDGNFSLDLGAGAIRDTGVSTIAAINVANKPDVCLQLADPKKMCAKAIAAYDLTVDNSLHYVFTTPVALTFAFGPGEVTSFTDLQVAVFNEVSGDFEPRSDTSCLAAFGRVPFTGSPAAGGTISVCTTTVSLWALIDTSTLTPANEPPVANAGLDQTIEMTAPTMPVQLDGSASSDPDGDALTYTWTGPFGAANGVQPVVTLGRGAHPITLMVDDGNDATATDDVLIDLRDNNPPLINIVTPPNGASYLLGQPGVQADYECTDSVSGVATCIGGPAIDTSVAGPKTFTVDASDVAGNVASLTNAYAIHYAFSGFRAPVASPPAVNAARGGITIPLKWQLRDAAGSLITKVETLQSLASMPLACDATPEPFIAGDPAFGAGGKPVRYDLVDEQFVFNWQTSTTWTGCRILQLTLDDGSRWLAKFAFK